MEELMTNLASPRMYLKLSSVDLLTDNLPSIEVCKCSTILKTGPGAWKM